MHETLDSVASRLLICEINCQRFAIEVDSVVELLTFQKLKITTLPNVPGHIHGVINLRGTTMSVLDTRKILGMPSSQEETNAILRMLSDQEQDHLDWVEELTSSVQNSCEFDRAIQPGHCQFGRWYDELMSDRDEMGRFANDQLALLDVLARFDMPHRELHAIAAEVNELTIKGEVEQAIKIIDQAKETHLKELLELFARTRELVGKLRQGVVIVIEHDSNRFGLVVDNACEVRDFASDCFTPNDESTGQVLGFVNEDNSGDLVQVLNIAAITRQCVSSAPVSGPQEVLSVPEATI